MATRSIAIRITLDNRDALNAAKAQVVSMRAMSDEVDKHTHLQNGMTNSFIKGNLAARAISIGYGLAKDALVGLIGPSIAFEQTMTKIAAVSGGSKLAMASLENSVRSLSLATNQSQGEIAKTALEMGKMGLSSNQVEKALGSVVMLSRALDEGLVKTGETVVGVMNAYNMSASDTDKITNQLAFTVKESALDMEKFGTAFSYAGGTAAAAGVSFEELQGAMDILSNAGIKASTIGTSLRRIISDLSDENSKASKAAGGTIESYGGLANVLAALKEKNIDVAGLTEIFGRTASSTSSIVIKYSAAIADLAKRTGEAKDIIEPMSNLMNTTFKSSIDGVTTEWADLGIEISKSTGFLSKFAQLAEKTLAGVVAGLRQAREESDFQEKDPEGYKKARASLVDTSFAGRVASAQYGEYTMGGGKDRAIRSTSSYRQYKFNQASAGDKDLSESLLMESFGKQKLPKGFKDSPESYAKIQPEDTAMYGYVQRLWGTDEKGFKLAVDKAKLNWALKAEKVGGDPFDMDSISDKKGGKTKKALSAVASNAISAKEVGDWSTGNRLASEVGQNAITKGEVDDFAKHQRMANKIVNASKKEDGKIEQMKSEQAEELALLTVHGVSVAEVRKAQEQELHDFIIALHRKELQTKLATGADFVGSMGQLMTTLAGKNKALAIAGKALASGEVILNTAVAVSKVWGQTGIFGFAAQAAPIASGLAQLAAINAVHFASGTDQVVTKPTMFMAGESGKERVTVTPRSKMSSDRSGGGITVNIQGDVLDGSKFAEAVEMAQKRLSRGSV